MSTDDSSAQDVTLDLLKQGVAGDRECLWRLWEEHRPRLEKLVKLRLDRRLSGRIDAEDVLQEAFVDFTARAGEYVNQPEMPFFSLASV